MFYPQLGPSLLTDLYLSVFTWPFYLSEFKFPLLVRTPAILGDGSFLPLPLYRLLTSDGHILRYCGLGLNL